MGKAALSFFVLTSCILLYTGCGRSQSVIQSDAKGPYAAAVHLYENGCITCHGDNLQGGIGPNLQHVGSLMTLQAIVHRIDVGAGPMPGYGPKQQGILTNAQIRMLAQWLATKK